VAVEDWRLSLRPPAMQRGPRILGGAVKTIAFVPDDAASFCTRAIFTPDAEGFAREPLGSPASLFVNPTQSGPKKIYRDTAPISMAIAKSEAQGPGRWLFRAPGPAAMFPAGSHDLVESDFEEVTQGMCGDIAPAIFARGQRSFAKALQYSQAARRGLRREGFSNYARFSGWSFDLNSTLKS